MTGPARKQPGQELLALITARGGSKGLPRKNVLPLAGQPLIAWSIQAAQAAACRLRVVVSTDDEEIANAALAHGAEVPFVCPADLAQDDSPHIDVILHAVHWLEHQRGYRPTWVLLLQPTSPLRLAQDIDQSLAPRPGGQLGGERAGGPLPPLPGPDHRRPGPAAPLSAAPPGLPAPPGPAAGLRLQWRHYLVSRQMLLDQQALWDQDTLALVMPPERSLDVDSAWDLHLAELILTDRQARAAMGRGPA